MNQIQKLTDTENERQKSTLNLIASENYPSPKALTLLGSIWNDKYAEGYPGKRYYAGNVNADSLEEFVQTKALEVFDAREDYGVNVQVLSGSPANAMVYFTVLEPGDTILSLNLTSGGHLSHLHTTSSYIKFFKHATYNLRGTKLHEAEFELALREHKPRLVVIGFSSYPAQYEFAQLCKLAHEYGALVLADISHIAGLVATGNHSSPFARGASGADFVTTTTHKTLRGPRSGLLFARKEYMPAINKTVFPGTSGGPHLNQIAAVGQSLLEVLGEDAYPDKILFGKYIENVVKNAKALETGLKKAGVHVSTPTSTHLVLAKLPEEVDSLTLQNDLEEAGIITNRNAIPEDSKSVWRPGGLRLGSAALTSRGMKGENFLTLGEAIGGLVIGTLTKTELSTISKQLQKELHWYY
ncbi:MAG: serine hydroxymethyltransferase [Candidatus Saccharibacteria bacterium]